MEQAGEYHVPAFPTPNYRVQATAYSLRFAALCSGFQPRLTRGVRCLKYNGS
jgi:hypothetical protein